MFFQARRATSRIFFSIFLRSFADIHSRNFSFQFSDAHLDFFGVIVLHKRLSSDNKDSSSNTTTARRLKNIFAFLSTSTFYEGMFFFQSSEFYFRLVKIKKNRTGTFLSIIEYSGLSFTFHLKFLKSPEKIIELCYKLFIK